MRGFVFTVGFSNSFYDYRFDDVAAQNDIIVSSDKSSANFGSLCLDESTQVGAVPRSNKVSGQVAQWRKAITVGASPYLYPSTADTDIVAREHTFNVTGGTVSAIEQSYDGTTFDATGMTSGAFIHKPGTIHRITYSVLPTVVAIG